MKKTTISDSALEDLFPSAPVSLDASAPTLTTTSTGTVSSVTIGGTRYPTTGTSTTTPGGATMISGEIAHMLGDEITLGDPSGSVSVSPSLSVSPTPLSSFPSTSLPSTSFPSSKLEIDLDHISLGTKLIVIKKDGKEYCIKPDEIPAIIDGFASGELGWCRRWFESMPANKGREYSETEMKKLPKRIQDKTARKIAERIRDAYMDIMMDGKTEISVVEAMKIASLKAYLYYYSEEE